ncbi:pyrimidine-specific ribonucleoside hydrolase RihA-like [Culicoides brevitarsis]|uniref:pyrimidine-specific ribonucleoside hydrolase RihA-like n=1 Tax=Culicoides brevitarsis TaxID=469753 RepID=UPI00307B647B
METKSVVIDVDVGADDAWALLLALNNEKLGNYKIRAITCTFGNTTLENVGKNVLKVLETVDRLDIPIFLGSSEPLIIHSPKNGEKDENFHGSDGLGDVIDPKTHLNPDLLQKTSAIEAIRDILLCDKNVHLICLGPLTNIALLLKMHPNVRDKIREITIMGGNRHGVGNITRAAEFNFHCDPEAAFIVFQSARCPIKLLPLESVKHNKMIEKSWRFDVLGKVDGKITKLMNPIEEKLLSRSNFWYPFDAYAVASFIKPEIVKRETNLHVTIELGGFFTRGQVVIDHVGKEKCKNVTVFEEIDIEMFRNLMKEVVDAQKN